MQSRLVCIIVVIFFWKCVATVYSPGVNSNYRLPLENKIHKTINFYSEEPAIIVFKILENNFADILFDVNNSFPKNSYLSEKIQKIYSTNFCNNNLYLISIFSELPLDISLETQKWKISIDKFEHNEILCYNYNYVKTKMQNLPYNSPQRIQVFPKYPEQAYEELLKPRSSNFFIKEIYSIRCVTVFPKSFTDVEKRIITVRNELNQEYKFSVESTPQCSSFRKKEEK